MLDLVSSFLIGIGFGGALGALSAYLGWNASNTPFETKKFVGAVVTGVIAGIVIVFVNINGFKSAASDATGMEIILLLGTIAFSILGVDYTKAKLSAIIANKQPEPVVTETTI